MWHSLKFPEEWIDQTQNHPATYSRQYHPDRWQYSSLLIRLHQSIHRPCSFSFPQEAFCLQTMKDQVCVMDQNNALPSNREADLF